MSIAGEPPSSHAGSDSAQGPLDARQLEQIALAGARARRLRSVLVLARANGVTLLLAGVLCLPFAFFEPLLALVALGLLALGALELRGAAMWKRLDLDAPRWLARNQLALFLLVALYCGVNAYRAIHTPPSLGLDGIDPELSQQLQDLGSTLGQENASAAFGSALKWGLLAFYGVVALACAVYQGVCAHFYLSRGALLREHLERTPAWVREVERRWLGP